MFALSIARQMGAKSLHGQSCGRWGQNVCTINCVVDGGKTFVLSIARQVRADFSDRNLYVVSIII